MSAATTTAPLSALIHRPAKAETLAELPEIRVTGHLLTDAQLRFNPPNADGQVHASLLLRIVQPLGLPYEAWQYLGTEAAQHIAANAKTKLLRKGQQVTVYARGLHQRTDHGHAALVLEHVTDVIPLHIERNPADRKASAPLESSESDHAH
jgi:hypothetical protein